MTRHAWIIPTPVHELYRQALLLDDRLRHLPIPQDDLVRGHKLARTMLRSMHRLERRRRLIGIVVQAAAPTMADLLEDREKWLVT